MAKKLLLKNGEFHAWPSSLAAITKETGLACSKNPPLPYSRIDRDGDVWMLIAPTPSIKPEGDIVTEITPIHINADWTQQWKSRDHSQQEIKALKVSVRKQINVWRDAMQSQDIAFKGYDWDADARGRSEINNAVTIYGAGVPLPSGFEWTTANDEDVAITLPEIISLGGLVAKQYVSYHKAARAHKKALKLASTLPDIELIRGHLKLTLYM